MMMTVKQYVESRDSSETTIKRRIKGFGWELPINPLNKKQRLLSTEHQRLLDDSIGYTAPAVEPEILEPVKHYERSESVGMIIAEGEILKAQHLIPYQRPEENPLLQALQLQNAQREQANLARYEQINQDRLSWQDTQNAIVAAKRIQIIAAAEQEAYETHQLKKQLIAQATTKLEMMDLGFPVNQTPAPTPQTSPQSAASSSQPDWL